MNYKLSWAAAFGATGVLLGALGAHALETRLPPESLNSFNTAVRYQVWHALALMMLAVLPAKLRFLRAISLFWITGVFLFSGSIYLLTTRSLWDAEISFWGQLLPWEVCFLSQDGFFCFGQV
ncbi:MAG: DUF423 domain-containing protein [Owenweeksia sp.]|nr:DUF423 domain-containing protein [Owenweeksia sp.]